MLRPIRKLTALTAAAVLLAGAALAVGNVSEAKAFPSDRHHATPTMQQTHPDLF